MERNRQRIVEAGGPLGRTKRVTSDGIEDISNQMTGYVVIEAESHEEAARLFENHPHFAIFPGEGVEIMQCRTRHLQANKSTNWTGMPSTGQSEVPT